ncbi:hypothetical protein ONZ45_g10171 [Pleurotus djamor]|nr:hypothetical protein ONZ45_g10171 [Pleurotus djamor]
MSNASGVLNSLDLFQIILQHTSGTDHLHCALTCKAWTKVALDFLWRRVLDLKRVLSLLAPLIWNEAVSKWMLSRPIHTEDWATFEKYCGRIKVLRITADDIDPSVFTSVLARRSTTPLLPNLQELYCGANPSELDVFLGESVRNLQIIHSNGAAGDMHFDMCLRKLPLQSPNLTSLFVVCESLPEDADGQIHAVFQNVRLLASLRTLSIPSMSLTPWSMGVLSSMSSLKVLETTHPSPPNFPALMSEVSNNGFLSLQRLALATSLEKATACFATEFASVLSDLSIVSIDPEHGEACAGFIDMVSARWPSLRSLSIKGETFAHPDWLVIQPVTSLKHLHRLSLEFNLPLQLSGDGLHGLLSALPSLQYLEIGKSDGYVPTVVPNVTLLDVVTAGRHAPKLQYLGLYADCRPSFGLQDAKEMEPDTFQHLKTLQFYHSPVNQPHIVSLAFRKILPVTCTVKFSECSMQGRVGIEDVVLGNLEALRLLSVPTSGV